jgi:tetratricopeptide (TPR) repeat protein
MVLTVAGIVLLALSAVMQVVIDPGRKAYHSQENATNTQVAMGGLNNEFMLLPLLGFREAAAGLLWVRCDEFFHSGDYDAILPLVRLITWLDPHADNVYVTGAWHLDYNFTDASERSDRRYIAPAIALLDEGIVNNGNIPDIKFEKGWQLYDKVKDFAGAQSAFEAAIVGPNGNSIFPGPKDQDNEGFWPYAAPLKDVHMLAHTLEKRGRIPDAIAVWDRALKRSRDTLALKPNDFAGKSMRDAELHNRAEAIQRYYDRYSSTNHDHNNPTAYPGVYAPAAKATGKLGPFDVAFKPTIDVPRPRVFKVSGRINLPDGGRVDVRITDWNYKDRVAAKDLRALEPPDLSQTILIDSIAIRKASFGREMDMSKDPKMYSFSNKEGLYKIVLTFNARTTAPHIQDFSGWSAEGLTDSRPGDVYFDQDPGELATTMIDGQGAKGPAWDGKTIPFTEYQQPPRIIRITYQINRDQVLGNKPITDADIIPNDPTTTIMLK